MNTQEAYEAIRAHFRRPGARLAKSDGGACKYRSLEGQKCAVGCLIPDEAYDEGMEGSNLNPNWLANYPFVDGLLYGVDRQFLRSAQVLHDRVADSVTTFVVALDALAAAHGLAVPDGGEDVVFGYVISG